MNWPINQSKFGKKYRDNYDRIFAPKDAELSRSETGFIEAKRPISDDLYEKKPMGEREKHIRRCTICRHATNTNEMCDIGKKL